MPVALPDRFRLEVRLGRDGDLEEWLATDGSLDRPVLIRMLGPESDPARRRAFLESVQQASKVSHPHLAAVYLVEETADGAYSVSEWTGGATLRSRLLAGDTIDPDEFLPNASGLAAALGALHEAGVVHGGIDLDAITYTVAHPAKLGAFGRRSRGATPHDDVRTLSEALEEGLTGSSPGTTPPSEVIDGLSPDVDRILRAGRRSALGARALSEAFAGAPTPRRAQPESTRPSRRLLLVAIGLAVAALGLVGLGRLFTPSGTPIPPPPAAPEVVGGDVTTSTVATTTTTTLTASPPIRMVNPTTFDPYGGGGENDDLVEAVADGDSSTSWRTEVYLDPLPLLKPGVGLTIDVTGSPRSVEILGLASEARLEIRWAVARSQNLEHYETIARVVSQPGVTPVQLPPRENGTWLVWFTDLPPVDGDYVAAVSEIRFRE